MSKTQNLSWNIAPAGKRYISLKGISLTLLAAAALAGCGGGGGGSAATLPGTPPPVNGGGGAPSGGTGRFAPNYIDELQEVLHWETQDISIYIAPNNTPEITQMVQHAASLWATGAEQQIRFHLTDNAELADITLQMVPAGSLGATTSGRTKVVYHESLNHAGWQMLEAEVAIDAGLERRQMFDTVVHELGHALGIDGHSSFDGDAMFAISEPPTEVTVRDANTLKTAYAWIFGGETKATRSRAQGAPRTHTVSCPRH